jgi:hypothetical protein
VLSPCGSWWRRGFYAIKPLTMFTYVALVTHASVYLDPFEMLLDGRTKRKMLSFLSVVEDTDDQMPALRFGGYNNATNCDRELKARREQRTA